MVLVEEVKIDEKVVVLIAAVVVAEEVMGLVVTVVDVVEVVVLVTVDMVVNVVVCAVVSIIGDVVVEVHLSNMLSSTGITADNPVLEAPSILSVSPYQTPLDSSRVQALTPSPMYHPPTSAKELPNESLLE